MNAKEAYKQKMENELELVQTKLAESKTQPNGSTVWERAKYIRKMKELEQRVTTCRAIMKDLDEGSAVFWGQTRKNMENAWASLQTEMQKAITSA